MAAEKSVWLNASSRLTAGLRQLKSKMLHCIVRIAGKIVERSSICGVSLADVASERIEHDAAGNRALLGIVAEDKSIASESQRQGLSPQKSEALLAWPRVATSSRRRRACAALAA